MIATFTQSSQLRQLEQEGTTLTVQFTNGREYRYFDVPPTVFNRIVNESMIQKTGSAGSLFHQLVRKAGYRYEEVIPDE